MMSDDKVLAPRELLSDALKTIHGLAPDRFSAEKGLRALLSAQPSDGALTNEGAEPVAWRNFDGEGNYDYTDDEETAQSWIAHNGPKYRDWCQELFLSPPAPASVALPERKREFTNCGVPLLENLAWNACLDQFKELNS